MITLTRIRQLRIRYGLSAGLLREGSHQFDRLFHRTDENSLAEDLRLLGIKAGDIIFVHSAMSRVGHVVGGPEAIIRALEMTVGYEATIGMPAYPTGGVTYDWVKDSPTFDVKTTPSDFGALPRFFACSLKLFAASIPHTLSLLEVRKHDFSLNNTKVQIVPFTCTVISLP
jgi:aminoglycoside N3'-acetyltransferase